MIPHATCRLSKPFCYVSGVDPPKIDSDLLLDRLNESLHYLLTQSPLQRHHKVVKPGLTTAPCADVSVCGTTGGRKSDRRRARRVFSGNGIQRTLRIQTGR